MRPRALAPALALCLAACRSEAPTLRAACEAGSADACAAVAARLFVGTDGKPDEAEANKFWRREMDLRAKACAAGERAQCDKLTARGMVLTPLPLDPPKPVDAARSGVQVVMAVELHADGAILADGKPLANDDAVLGAARAAMERSPDLRAVIRADTSVPHGRVIRVLDQLKLAGITKIAFGVAAIMPADAGAR